MAHVGRVFVRDYGDNFVSDRFRNLFVRRRTRAQVLDVIVGASREEAQQRRLLEGAVILDG